MKREYKKPEILAEEVVLSQVIALSIQDGEADGSDALGKDRNRGFSGSDNKGEWENKLWE